jgi:transposase
MFVWLSLIVNQHRIPLFINTHSGNASDKSIILESIKSLKSNGSYTTEDIFTFLDKEGEVSYRGVSAMVGLMCTRLGILA